MKAGIYTVGSSAEPIWRCAAARKPEEILFVVSKASKSKVREEILPSLTYIPQFEVLLLRNEESLEDTYEDVRIGLTGWIERRGLDTRDLYFNYTGGTKSMSAGLALAAVELLPNYSYVSGVRDRDGLGIVVAGTERFVDGRNPWHRRAFKEREQATRLLATGMADSAAEVLAASLDNEPDNKESLALLQEFCQMLAEQQRFCFTKARGIANRITRRLALVFDLREPKFAEWLRREEHYLTQLAEQAKPDFPGPRLELLGELLLNAERCVLAQRYDDAVARLYRAVEMHGQNCLATVIPGAQSGKLYREVIAAKIWNEILGRNPSMKVLWPGQKNEQIVLGLGETYTLLTQLDPVACAAMREVYEEELKPCLQARNSSILAHGVQPMNDVQYKKLKAVLEHSLGIEAKSEYNWPAINFAAF